MKPKRVAFVHQATMMGGVEWSTVYLLRAIDRSAFEPLVICPQDGDLPRLCRDAGVATRIVPIGRTLSTSLRIAGHRIANPVALIANAIVLLAAAARLARKLRRERVDLVCTKGLLSHFSGGLAARLAGVPCVWHVQDLISDRAGGLYRRLLDLSARLLADAVIADGPSIVEQMPPSLRAAGRVHLVYNGIDTAEFSPTVDGAPVRAELGLRPDWLVVGNVARLTPWKGQHLLLEAAAKLAEQFPSAHFLIVGAPLFDSSAYERRLRQLAADPRLDGRVTFAGYRSDLAVVLAAIDIFAYASVEKDTSPLSLLSAMSAGKPIIAPRLSGVAELFVDGETGMLVQPGDASALTAALRCLLGDAQLCARLGVGARARAVRDLSIEAYAANCAAVFAQTLAHKIGANSRRRASDHGAQTEVVAE